MSILGGILVWLGWRCMGLSTDEIRPLTLDIDAMLKDKKRLAAEAMGESPTDRVQ